MKKNGGKKSRGTIPLSEEWEFLRAKFHGKTQKLDFESF